MYLSSWDIREASISFIKFLDNSRRKSLHNQRLLHIKHDYTIHIRQAMSIIILDSLSVDTFAQICTCGMMMQYLSSFFGPIWGGIHTFLLGLPIIFVVAHFFLRKYFYYHRIKFLVYVFILYVFVVVWLVWFPFPDFTPQFCAVRSGISMFQWVPIRSIGDMFTYPVDWRAIFQVVFNIVLLFPLGILLSFLTKRSSKKIIFVGFLSSILIEVSQWTWFFGIMPCAYRLFDIDDILLNTLWIALVARGVLWKKAMVQHRLHEWRIRTLPPSFVRRFFSSIVDFAFIRFFAEQNTHVWLSIVSSPLGAIITYFLSLSLSFFVFVVFIPYWTWGYSLWKYLAWLKIVPLHAHQHKPIFWQYLLRASVVMSIIILISVLERWYLIMWQQGSSVLIVVQIIYMYTIVVIFPIVAEANKDGVLFYEEWSRTKQIHSPTIRERLKTFR